MPVMLVFRCLYQGLRVAPNLNDSDILSNYFSRAFPGITSEQNRSPLGSLSLLLCYLHGLLVQPMCLLLPEQCLVGFEDRKKLGAFLAMESWKAVTALSFL